MAATVVILGLIFVGVLGESNTNRPPDPTQKRNPLTKR